MTLWTTAALWCTLVVMCIIQGTESLRLDCPTTCVIIQECPAFVKILRKPTTESIRLLQEATCSFSGRIPLVCCPAESTPAPTPSLLPRDCGEGKSDNRIHGGNETSLGAYPWMAIFGYKEVGFNEVEYLCAGSIINERYILTAAHCVEPNLLAFKRLEVIGLGEWDLETEEDCQESLTGDRVCAPPTQNFTHEEIIVHPQYNTRAIHSDDIALIRLSQKIDLSGLWLHPVCLPEQGLDIKRIMQNREGIAAGWGTTEHGTTSKRLLDVALPLVDNNMCNDTYDGNTIEEQICMGGVAGRDSCGGDSGGPLIVSGSSGTRYLQVGIVSYGPSNCGLEAIAGVYTDVSYYIDWIKETMRP